MRQKIAIYILIITIVATGIYALESYFQHSVKNDETLKNEIQQWLDVTLTNKPELMQVHESTTYISWIELDNGDKGIVELQKGWNNRFRIHSASYGKNKINYTVKTTNKGRYAIVYGENEDEAITTVKANLIKENYSIQFNIPKQQHFVVTSKLPKSLKFSKLVEVFAFDERNNEIRFWRSTY
ncbi:hypothetical protein [Lysinibacillus sp. 54212]|uniref:hypothetical protein n=1 Tax=Lysinibacillus sp. 54212 TaxID=3119829 RepID=UPI002FC6128B